MEVSIEDLRKKRSQEKHGKDEKSKKVRVDRDSQSRSPNRRRSNLAGSRSPDTSPNRSRPKKAAKPEFSSQSKSLSSDSDGSANKGSAVGAPRIWDLESALQYIVQTDEDEKEYLSTSQNEDTPWITFRVAHAGDASTISQWYRSCISTEEPELEIAASNNTQQSGEDPKGSMLEVWLEDGLGNEDVPPTLHALLVHIHNTTEKGNTSSLAAAALMTLAWSGSQRVLRIEWMQIDTALVGDHLRIVRERLWLRLSTISYMTACEIVMVDEEQTKTKPKEETSAEKNGPSPSAE